MEINTEKKIAAGLSITSNAIIIILKLIAGAISGSISIISEAIHSLSDFLASILTFFAVMKSSIPADENHPFGHGKYEDMSGFIEGGLIIFAAFYIIYEACKKLIHINNIGINTTIGIYVMLFAVISNIIVSSYILHIAKKSNSISLFADGEHLKTDIYSSLGVMLGLILIQITGIKILDPIIAIFVALFILKAGYNISKETLNNLLDGSLPETDLDIIKNIIEKTDGVSGFKSLKARKIGPSKDIEFTLLFQKDMTIEQCHKFCDIIENNIRANFGECSISIHAEPEYKKRSVKTI